MASLNLLGHYAALALALPPSPAYPPEAVLWRYWESLKEALRKASLRADLVDRPSSLASLPLAKHLEECLRWESPDQVSLN